MFQGVRERALVFETLNFFKRPDVAVLCAFSGNTIACSCSMSATGAPSKALKVRPMAAKHYQLRHSCLLPKSMFWTLCSLKNAKYLRIWRNITDSLSVVHEYLIFWFRAAELIHENKLWSWKYLFTLIIMVSQLVGHDTASNKTKLQSWLSIDLCSLKVSTIFRNNFVSFLCFYSFMGYLVSKDP